METYANQLSIFHGSDQWEAVRKALNLAANQPSQFTETELSDLLNTILAMREIEDRK